MKGSGLYWIVCHILAFFGVFLCLLMTSMYDTNIAITGGNNKQNPKVSGQHNQRAGTRPLDSGSDWKGDADCKSTSSYREAYLA